MNNNLDKELVIYQKQTALLGKKIQLAHKKATSFIHKGSKDNAKKLIQLGLVIDAMGATTLIIQNYLETQGALK